MKEDGRSGEILKPFLEGRKDLRAWCAKSRGLFLIYAYHGVKIKKYPAVLEHLKPHRRALERRATSANHEWYELQQPQMAYAEFFERPKVAWPELSEAPTFSIQPGGTYFNNKVYFVPGDDPYLLAVLASPPLWLSLTGIAREMRGGYFELFSQVVEKLPIPPKTSPHAAQAAKHARQISDSGGTDPEAIEHLSSTVCRLFGLSPDEEQLIREKTARRP